MESTKHYRRIVLVRADTREEAIICVKLMLKQLEQIPDNNDIIQSLYIDDVDGGTGSVWFG